MVSRKPEAETLARLSRKNLAAGRPKGRQARPPSKTRGQVAAAEISEIVTTPTESTAPVVTAEQERLRDILEKLQPHTDAEGSVSLVAALDDGQVGASDLAEVFGADPVEKAQLFIQDRTALKPHADAEGRIDVVGALRANADQGALGRMLPRDTLAEAKTFIAAEDELAPFRNADGSIRLTEALASGTVSQSTLDLLVANPSAVTESRAFLRAQSVVAPFLSNGSVNIKDALLNNPTGDQRREIESALTELGIAIPTIGNGSPGIPTGSFNVSSNNPVTQRAITAELRVRDANEELRRVTQRVARAERDLATNPNTKWDRQSIDRLKESITEAEGQIVRWETDRTRVLRLWNIHEAFGATTGIFDVTDPTANLTPQQRQIRAQQVGVDAARARIEREILDSVRSSQAAIVEQQRRTTQTGGIGPSFAPEDFEGGLDTPLVQNALTTIRERGIRSQEGTVALQSIGIPDTEIRRLQRRERESIQESETESRLEREGQRLDLISAGIPIQANGGISIPLNANESQIAAIQAYTGLSRRAIIEASLENRIVTPSTKPVSGLETPSAARAFSAQAQAKRIEEQESRRRLVAEQGLPPSIIEIQSRLADDVKFFTEATRISQSPGAAGGLPTAQQAEFESANRQLGIVNDVVANVESGAISMSDGVDIIQRIETAPTEQDIQSAEDLLTARLRLASSGPVGAIAGPVATFRDWDRMSGTGRAVDIGLDVLGAAGLILPAAGIARTTGGLAGTARAGRIAGAIGQSEILGPTQLIAEPIASAKATGRLLFDPVEVILRRGRVPGIEQARSTFRLEAEAGRGAQDIGTVQSAEITDALRTGEITAQDVKDAVTRATLDVINGRPGRAQVGTSDIAVDIRLPVAQESTGPAAFTGSPDIRNLIGSGFEVRGQEGGLFVSFSPHSRFADSTSTGASTPSLNDITKLQDRAARLERAGSPASASARQDATDALAQWTQFDNQITNETRLLIESGQLPNEPVPGVVWIRDPELLASARGSEQLPGGATSGVVIGDPGNVGKIFKGKAEFEAILPNGTVIPPASQMLFFRGADGKKYGIAVIGEPLTSAQIVKLKLSGTGAATQNIFAPPISVRVGKASDAQQLLKDADRISQQADDASAAGDIRLADRLEERADALRARGVRVAVANAQSANFIRSDAAQDARVRADEIEARLSGQDVNRVDLQVGREQATLLREQARVADESNRTVRSIITGLESGRFSIQKDRRGEFNVSNRQGDIRPEPIERRDIVGQPRSIQLGRIPADQRLAPVQAQERALASPQVFIGRGGDPRVPESPRITRITDSPRRPSPQDTPTPARLTRTFADIRPPDPVRLPPVVPPPPPLRTEIDDSELSEEERRLNLEVIGLNRGVYDTKVNLVTGETTTFKDLASVPEIRTRDSVTALEFGERTPRRQVIPWGVFNAVVKPDRTVAFHRVKDARVVQVQDGSFSRQIDMKTGQSTSSPQVRPEKVLLTNGEVKEDIEMAIGKDGFELRDTFKDKRFKVRKGA